MTKVGWMVAVVVLLVLAGIGFATYMVMKNSAPVAEQTPEVLPATHEELASTSAPVVTVPVKETVVSYTDTGFTPKSVETAVGGTVRFVNNSTRLMWVGVNEHPSHTQYDGTSTKEHCADGKNLNNSFDQCVASAPGTTFTYTFTKSGTFNYHNHKSSGDTGTVIVK